MLQRVKLQDALPKAIIGSTAFWAPDRLWTAWYRNHTGRTFAYCLLPWRCSYRLQLISALTQASSATQQLITLSAGYQVNTSIVNKMFRA